MYCGLFVFWIKLEISKFDISTSGPLEVVLTFWSYSFYVCIPRPAFIPVLEKDFASR